MVRTAEAGRHYAQFWRALDEKRDVHIEFLMELVRLTRREEELKRFAGAVCANAL